MTSVKRVLLSIFATIVVGYLLGCFLDMKINENFIIHKHLSWLGLIISFVFLSLRITRLHYELIGIRIFAFLDQDMHLHIHRNPPTGRDIQTWQRMRVSNEWNRPRNKHDLLISPQTFINGSYLELSLGGTLRLMRKHMVHSNHYSPWSVVRANTLDDILVRDRAGGMIGGLPIGDILIVINQTDQALRYVRDINALRNELEVLGHATTATIHYLKGGKGRTPSRMAAKAREMLSAGIDMLGLREIEELNRWTKNAPEISEEFITELEKNPVSPSDPDAKRPKLNFPDVLKRN